ncbi:MAG: S-layer protein, partial [Candidatus Methanofastidiosia archaeon]
GPEHYFTIIMTDGTWDDDKDGIKDTEWDDGIDFSVEFRVPGATYTERTAVDIDPAELVKLDVEVDPSAVDKNLILIGGAVANSIVQQLVDMGVGPDDGSAADWFTTEGDFKLYTDPFGTTKDVLVVAGPDREATRAAAMDLISQMG